MTNKIIRVGEKYIRNNNLENADRLIAIRMFAIFLDSKFAVIERPAVKKGELRVEKI